jgi:hypothetical protein
MIAGRKWLGEVPSRTLPNPFAAFAVKDFDRKIRKERKADFRLLKSA